MFFHTVGYGGEFSQVASTADKDILLSVNGLDCVTRGFLLNTV